VDVAFILRIKTQNFVLWGVRTSTEQSSMVNEFVFSAEKNLLKPPQKENSVLENVLTRLKLRMELSNVLYAEKNLKQEMQALFIAPESVPINLSLRKNTKTI